MKRRAKKLQLSRETLSTIDSTAVNVAGGRPAPILTIECDSVLNTCLQATCGVCACGPSCYEPCLSDPCEA